MAWGAWSAAQVVRNALQEWAKRLVEDLYGAATVQGGPTEPGQVPPLPTLGLEWGATEVEHARPTDHADRWQLHYEEVQLAFVWRAASLEQADLFAHTFALRAAREGMASNPDGNRTLHFEVQVAGLDGVLARLYLDGSVTPVAPDENLTRGLYTYRVAGAVSYPVLMTEGDLLTAGRAPFAPMNIVVTINGARYALEEIHHV